MISDAPQLPRREQTHLSLRTTHEEYDDEIDVRQGIRFLHANRWVLLSAFLKVAAVGLCCLALFQSTRPLKITGSLVLAFKGIEKGEYPSGRRFSIEDLRSPQILSMALVDAKLAATESEANKNFPDVNVEPIIPRAIAAAWAKQDHDGGRRDEYFPNVFRITLFGTNLSPAAGKRLFEAIVKRYRERVIAEQTAVLQVANHGSAAAYYQALLKDPNYEYVDILEILDGNARVLNQYLNRTIEDLQGNYTDLSLQFTFRDLQNAIKIWSATYVDKLSAMTYEGRYVKNKGVALAKLGRRRSDLDIELKRMQGETAEALKLLASLQKPQFTSAFHSGKDAAAAIDASILDRLMSNNYVGPLVKRISDLQKEAKALEAEAMRLNRDAGVIAQGRNIDIANLPPNYMQMLVTTGVELERIVDRYNGFLDRYFASTIANMITVKEWPAAVREGPSMRVLISCILLLSAVISCGFVFLRSLLNSALQEDVRAS